MFYIIGDCKDITVKGLEIIERCDKVYLEAYTSILTGGTEALPGGLQYCDKVLEGNVADINVKQPTLESLTKKNKEYMPPKFMSVSEASQHLLEILRNKGQDDLVTENTLCIGLVRVGSETEGSGLQPPRDVPGGFGETLTLSHDVIHILLK